jgi:hypothetical protein
MKGQMNLSQVADNLPNGFHDAEIDEILLDCQKSSAQIRLRIWVSTEESQPDVYKPAVIRLYGVLFFVIDPHSREELGPPPFGPSEGSWGIDGVVTTEDIMPSLKTLRQYLPSGIEPYSFYVENSNSFIHIAAAEATLTWLDLNGDDDGSTR